MFVFHQKTGSSSMYVCVYATTLHTRREREREGRGSTEEGHGGKAAEDTRTEAVSRHRTAHSAARSPPGKTPPGEKNSTLHQHSPKITPQTAQTHAHGGCMADRGLPPSAGGSAAVLAVFRRPKFRTNTTKGKKGCLTRASCTKPVGKRWWP